MNAQKVTKTLVRQWTKRVREDLREIEAALASDDWDGVVEWAMDASGAAGEITTMAETKANDDGPDVTNSYRP